MAVKNAAWQPITCRLVQHRCGVVCLDVVVCTTHLPPALLYDPS